jgi:hypothetical protein
VFNLLAGLSLAPWMATLSLWVFGYFHCAGLEEKRNDRIVLFETVRGGFQYARVDEDTRADWSTPGWFFSIPYDDPVVTKRYCGFGSAEVVFPKHKLVTIDIPAYPFAFVFGIVPVTAFHLWMRRLRAARRSTKQLCTNCGYDLRATPNRCPECGSIPVGNH